MINGVIFDMDGLMFDTESVYGIYWRQVSTEMGYPMDDALVAMMCGAIRDFQIKAIRSRMGEGAPAGEIIDECMRRTREHIANNAIPVRPATGTRRVSADDMIVRAELLEYIDAMVCGDEVSACKPDPEIFLKAAALIGVPPQECIVLEDSYNGIRAAHAAGAQPIMIPDTMQPTDEIRSLCAHVFERLDEVITLV